MTERHGCESAHVDRARLAAECAKFDRAAEKSLAEEDLGAESDASSES